MPDESNLWIHLARGVEELLRGAADVVARARGRLEDQGQPGEKRADPQPDPLEDLRLLWEWGKRHALVPLRDAVREEARRWEARAVDDAAAARVHEIFQTLLEILEEEPDGHRSGGGPRERAREGDGCRSPGREDFRRR
jgi:hypothetical protein